MYAETQDKVTLLTEADVFGTWAGSAAEAKQYTLGKEGIIVPEEMRIAQYDGTADSYWLRSIQNNSVGNTAGSVTATGTLSNTVYDASIGIRPVLWVTYQ